MTYDLGRRARRLAPWAALFLCGCIMDDEFLTREGYPPTGEEKREFVDGRAAPPQSAEAAKEPLTLLAAVDLVTEGSTDLAQVRAQVLQSAADVDLAKSALLPKLAIGATVLAYAKSQGTGGFFRRDSELFDLQLELSIPLDLSGRLKERLRAAQARYRAAKTVESAALREQRFLAATAFFNYAAAEDLRVVVAATIEAQERALADAKARVDAGVLRRNDYLTTEVTLAQTRHRLFEVETAIHGARRALNAATGLPIDHPTRIVPFAGLVDVPADAAPLLARSRHDNPEVDVLVETRQALLHEYEAADRGSLPDVSIGPRAAYSSESISDPKFTFLGFISASWNPDLNGETKARTDAVAAQLLENAAAVTGLLRRIEGRILQAHRQVADRRSALGTAEASAASARENLRIFEAQFRAGTATAREVLEAQSLLAETEGTLRTSRHQANLAAFETLYVAGGDPRAAIAERAGS
jgi:outer membrane protein TolC